jgi:hypothetical protein
LRSILYSISDTIAYAKYLTLIVNSDCRLKVLSSRVGRGLSMRFPVCKREAKQERKSAWKRARKKLNCRTRKKKARIRAFSSLPHWKPDSRSQSLSAGGKARVLSKMDSTVHILNIISLFIIRDRGEETERRDRGEETEG